jgi:hypothetical protein
MKRPFLLAALAAITFGSTLCGAQQGPAGVPGVFGLAESVTGNPSAPARARQPAPQDECATSKQPEQCRARQEARKKALAACAGKTGAARKQCLSDYQQKQECKKASEPTLCLRQQKARTQCAQKPEAEYRQCLRDILAPKN